MKDTILRKVSISKRSDLKRGLFKCSTLVFLMLLANFAVAQTISGTIIDENNEPVIGANIIVDGTTIGTTTDIDGKKQRY